MKKERLDFLKRLMDTICPSGHEQDAAKVWKEEAQKFSKSVYGDIHGNSFALINGNANTSIMLAGHIDEIGMVVTHIDKNGFISFQLIGGWDKQIFPGQHIQIKTKHELVDGVIGRKPIHLMKAEEAKKVATVDDLWIDIGAKNKKETSKIIEIGDPAVISSPGLKELRNKRVVGRAFDDRIGAFIVLEATRLAATLKPKVAIYAVATVQEEVGMRGAITSSYSVNPTAGIVVDVRFTTDTPGLGSEEKRIGEAKLGKGPIITKGANTNPRLYDIIMKVAKKKKIPHQISISPGHTRTDTWEMQVSRRGVATALVSVPNRYMHSPCEMIDLNDVDNIIKLLAHTIVSIDDRTNFIP